MRAMAFAVPFGGLLASSAQAQQADPAESIERVDPHVFRACVDPRNQPFSNEVGEGYENKIAERFAAKLGKRLAYAFYPGAAGFIRNTLNAHRLLDENDQPPAR